MSQKEQLLAFVVYEIRLLLAGHLGSQSASDPSVRAAAHLAYALHNEANSALQGNSFDTQEAIERLGAVDRILGTDFQDRFGEVTTRET